MSDLNDLIHSNANRAFNTGRKYEYDRIMRAIEECRTSNEIDDLVYIKDLMWTLENPSEKAVSK